MAHPSIELMGVTWPDVPAVDLLASGGGSALYHDVTDTTATASDVAQGKLFHAADGTLTTGTASGGGSSSWTLIKSATLTVSTTSTSAASAGTVACGTAAWTDKNVALWVHIRGQSGKRAGYFYGSDALFLNFRAANGSTTSNAVPTILYTRVNSDETYTCASGQYGVYGYSVNTSGTLTIRRRYNSTNTLTINDTFNIEVYALAMPSGVTLFE